MNFKSLLQDDDAVSPVIGVILMVAITVILAAVIGTFVLGLGDQVSNTSPSVSFSFDFQQGTSLNADGCNLNSNGNELTITHDGGDGVGAGQLSISAGGSSDVWSDCSAVVTGNDVTAGDQAFADVSSSDTLRVVWQSSSGGDTATLGKWTGPDA